MERLRIYSRSKTKKASIPRGKNGSQLQQRVISRWDVGTGGSESYIILGDKLMRTQYDDSSQVGCI